MMDILSAFMGITTPAPELYSQIAAYGWEPTKVEFDRSLGKFTAEAQNQYGEKIKKDGPNDQTALGNLLIAIMRHNHMRTAAQRKVGMWKTMFTDQLQPIAEAYAKAPVYDPKAAAAFKELADDSMRRYQTLAQQLHIEVVDDPEPYANAKEMADDIHQKHHFYVSRANSEHPLWSVEQNVAFRTVHDVLGHAVSGGDFGWQGENLACAAHFPLLSVTAQQALFTECFAPETLVRTESGYRPISEIQVGDRVLSGNGEFNEVYAVHERDHEGELVKFETKSSLGSIRVTPEHPFHIVHGEHPRKGKKLVCNLTNCHRHPEYHRFEWLSAGDLTTDSYIRLGKLETPTEQFSISVPDKFLGPRPNARRGPRVFEITPEFLWVIGMYLAEGSASNGSLSFGLHAKETEYAERLRRFFSEYGYRTRLANGNSENGVEFTVNSSILAEWWPQWLGKGCQNKKIPTELLNLPTNWLDYLIEGVMDGDGHWKRNSLAQTSPLLALQVAEIAIRLGCQPSISTWVKEGKKNVYGIEEASPRKVTRRRSRRGFWTLDGGTAVKVTSVRRVPYIGKVYDLSVANDPSYVVHNIVAHNCIAQTAYAAYYRSFGPQKVALFPEFTDPTQAVENDPNHRGIHPSQVVAPTAMPTVEPSPSGDAIGLPQGTVAPHMEGLGLTPVMSPTFSYVKRYSSLFADPNKGWSSGIDPMTLETHGVGNAYLDHGDPLGSQDVMDNASLIDTKWHSLAKGDGTPDRERMKLAIVNAFRVVLLSPRKDLRWNAIHYQDISHIPASTDDPKVYWEALEGRRRAWNEAQGIDPTAHMPYFKFLKPFQSIIHQLRPHWSYEKLERLTNRLLFNWWTEEQQRIEAEDADKPSHKQRPMDEIERRANEALAKRLQVYIKDKTNPKTDVRDVGEPMSLFGALGDQYNLLTGEPALKYGAFMGTHLKAISKISQHSDELLDAALEDVHEHDATGHHFRAKTLSLGISGVGPKVCSFAWLLLQPMTSQLATIDTHMMDVLGHNYEKEMNNRDYFKFERELAAGRDAAGYSHVPLGAFQWGMWDFKRTGPGSHQDHSAMRVLDPVPHGHIDWASKAQNLKGGSWLEQAPDWWRNTQPARDAVAQEWDQNVAPNVAQNAIPFQRTANLRLAAMMKEAGENEDEFHVGITLPEEVFVRCSEIADEIPGIEKEKPENYHITMFWTPYGYSDKDLHDWIRSRSVQGLRFEKARIDSFPTQDNRYAVVLRLESSEAKVLANKLMDEAEDRGLEIKRFEGGWKAHITLGWTDEPLEEKPKYPDVQFRAGHLYVSIPRPLRKTADFSKGFEYWWNKRKPVHEYEAEIMAEYARGTKTSRKDALEFIEKHKSDVEGDYDEFKKNFIQKFKALRTSETTPAYERPAPWIRHPDGESDVGAPGESAMQFARLNYPNLSTPEIWQLLGEEGAGKSNGGREGEGN